MGQLFFIFGKGENYESTLGFNPTKMVSMHFSNLKKDRGFTARNLIKKSIFFHNLTITKKTSPISNYAFFNRLILCFTFENQFY